MNYSTLWGRIRHGTSDRADKLAFAFIIVVFALIALAVASSLISCSTHQPPGAGLDVGLCATVVCHPA